MASRFRILLPVAAIAMGCAGRPTARATIVDDFDSMVSYNWSCLKEAAVAGDWDLYLSGYTWHSPWSYSTEQLMHLNSRSWGGGFGRSIVDKYGNIQSVWLMGFSDSHFHGEFNLGYEWMHYFPNNQSDLRFGLGYSVFLFSRRDIASYVPIPAGLPLVSGAYKRVAINATFIPRVGKIEQGNTVYVFATIHL